MVQVKFCDELKRQIQSLDKIALNFKQFPTLSLKSSKKFQDCPESAEGREPSKIANAPPECLLIHKWKNERNNSSGIFFSERVLLQRKRFTREVWHCQNNLKLCS